MDLEVGKAYFEISWATDKTQIPDIETYIYIGKNIFGREPEEHYFQTPYSYEKHGNFAEMKEQSKKVEAEIILMRPDIIETLFSLSEVIDHLKSLEEKHSSLFGVINR